MSNFGVLYKFIELIVNKQQEGKPLRFSLYQAHF